jgi:hypothetical protein
MDEKIAASVMLTEKDPPNFCKFEGTLKRLGHRRRVQFRMFLYMKQLMCCHYCKRKMTLDFPTKDNPKQSETLVTFEHLEDEWTPEGKNDAVDRVVLACFKCNNTRNNERQERAINYYKARAGKLTFNDMRDPRALISRYGHWEFTDPAQQGTMDS